MYRYVKDLFASSEDALHDRHKSVYHRVEDLPPGVLDCERCDSTDSMTVRRSSLNHAFFADDVTLKCMNCWYVATHGIPFETPEEFAEELANRDSRVMDFANDPPSGSVEDRLEALGYVAKSKSVASGDK